jgi:hypothetical protein
VPRYYLDTTAQLEGWAGDESTRQRVNDLLGKATHATSTHVLREWKHIIEGGCADVLNALRDRPGSLSDLYSRLSQGWGREPSQRLRVLSLLTGESTGIDPGEIELRAAAMLRYRSASMFETQIDEIRDGSECGLARNVVVRDSGGRWAEAQPETGRDRCKKDDTICRQDDDLGSKLDRLEAAGRALLASSDTNHRTAGKTALQAVKVARDRKGKNCYGYLGDVSIALECGEGETVLTTDRSFEVMAPALEIDVERVAPTPSP